MKYTLTILFLGYITLCNAQKQDTLKNGNFFQNWSSSNTVMAIEYGIATYQFQRVNNDFTTLHGTGFKSYIGMIAVSVSECIALNRKYTFDAHLDYAYYHSMPVIYEENDSSRFYIGGFHIGLDACKDLFPKRRAFDFLIGVGFNAGQLTFGNWSLLIENKENRHNKYKNPFFAPKLSLEPRVILFNKLTLSIRSEIQLDVTNPKWKQKNDALPSIAKAAASGYNARFTIGWNLSSSN